MSHNAVSPRRAAPLARSAAGQRRGEPDVNYFKWIQAAPWRQQQLCMKDRAVQQL